MAADFVTPPLVRRRRDSLLGAPSSSSPSRNVSLQVLRDEDDLVSRIVYEVPAPKNEDGTNDPLKGAGPLPFAFSAPFTSLLARLTILLSRSSGRDKLSAVIQYGSLAAAEFTPSGSPWSGLEDTISKARKVFRLFKWIKELERARQCEKDWEDHGTGKVLLKVLMHLLSAFYYAIDNLIWTAQVGLINQPVLPEGGDLRRLLFDRMSWSQLAKVQSKHKELLELQRLASSRISRWKDYKNWFSLARLLISISYALLQLRALRKEEARVKRRYRQRIVQVRSTTGVGADTGIPVDSSDGEEESELRGALRSVPGGGQVAAEASSSSLGADVVVLSVEEQMLRRERAKRLRRLRRSTFVYSRDMVRSVCNLGILCKWLGIGPMRHIPVWGVGVLGITQSLLGLHKNWPREIPKDKPTPSLFMRPRDGSLG